MELFGKIDICGIEDDRDKMRIWAVTLRRFRICIFLYGQHFVRLAYLSIHFIMFFQDAVMMVLIIAGLIIV